MTAHSKGLPFDLPEAAARERLWAAADTFIAGGRRWMLCPKCLDVCREARLGPPSALEEAQDFALRHCRTIEHHALAAGIDVHDLEAVVNVLAERGAGSFAWPARGAAL